MIKTGLTAEELERSALLLNGLLADHFTLLLKTWQFHWNVVGNSFGSYHEGMLKLYEAEIERVDDVAETVFNNVDSGTVVVRSTFAVPPSEAGFILAKIFHPL